jgi:uncharacterized membrane protein YgdD (TMEM256/DUF423 family)
MIAALKRLALFAIVGAFLADVLALAFAPALLRWFQTPAVGGALCNCAQLAEETARSLVRVQGVAAVIGAAVVVVAGELGFRALARRRSAAAIALVAAGPGPEPR